MICPKCGEDMEVKSIFMSVQEDKGPRNPISYVCPACKHSVYKEYKSSD